MICPDCKHDAFSHDAARCTHRHLSSARVVHPKCDCRLSRGDVIDRHDIEHAFEPDRSSYASR